MEIYRLILIPHGFHVCSLGRLVQTTQCGPLGEGFWKLTSRPSIDCCKVKATLWVPVSAPSDGGPEIALRMRDLHGAVLDWQGRVVFDGKGYLSQLMSDAARWQALVTRNM
jgi:hypothetical protein